MHKHKNEGTAVRRQQDGDVSEKGISKQRLLSAVDGNKSLAEIKLFLHSKVDDQNVPIVENFFTSILLRKELIEHGFWREVAWMIVFSEAYQAFELSSLDHADCNDRLDVQRRLLSAAIFVDVHDIHCAHAHGTAQLFGCCTSEARRALGLDGRPRARVRSDRHAVRVRALCLCPSFC